VNIAALDLIWREIDHSTHVGSLAGRSVPDLDHGSTVMLAVDRAGLRHLLLAVDRSSAAPTQPVSKGLSISVDELSVGERPARHYLDIACRDAAMHPNFTAVAAEIIDALPNSDDVIATVTSIFARWRLFWGVAADELSEEQVIGLFGELWFLEFWLAPIDAAVLAAWAGPRGDRHDFKWPAASVEIKATRVRSDGAARHRISSLDQLEAPEQGELYLFSLRATPDPIGAHSLRSSVDRLRDGLSARPELLQDFDERLAAAGYSPAYGEQYGAGLRVAAEELYRVSDGFPRLDSTSFRAGVPNGVDRISYTLDLVACEPWRVATAPGSASNELRATVN
jgi:hypothetical protein